MNDPLERKRSDERVATSTRTNGTPAAGEERIFSAAREIDHMPPSEHPNDPGRSAPQHSGDPIAAGRVRAVLARLLDDGIVTASDGSVHTLSPVAMPAAEGEAIRSWIVRERATRTIEIGLGCGISALFACEGLLTVAGTAARHVVIDPHQSTGFANCGLQMLEEAGVSSLIEHYPEASQSVLPRLVADGRKFDLAVVDGNHRFDAVFVDLYYLGRLLSPGGIVFLDDWQLPGVARAAGFFQANVGWTLAEVNSEQDLHHWAVLRTNTQPDARPFDYFADF